MQEKIKKMQGGAESMKKYMGRPDQIWDVDLINVPDLIWKKERL